MPNKDSRLKLVAVASPTPPEKKDCNKGYFPQIMFSCFSEPFRLDIDGMNGADQFRKKFTGRNPFHRLGIYDRFRSREDLILLVVKHGSYSCEEAETFIEKVLDRGIRYAETRKETKYFVLRKKRDEEYYLVLYARDVHFN